MAEKSDRDYWRKQRYRAQRQINWLREAIKLFWGPAPGRLKKVAEQCGTGALARGNRCDPARRG